MRYTTTGYEPIVPAAERVHRRLRAQSARALLLRRAERIDRQIDALARESAHLLGLSERIVATARAIRRLLFEALQDTGISPGQETLLMRLLEQPNCSLDDHARRLDVSPQTLSRSTRRLEAIGMLQRERHPLDPRVMHLTLTDAGRLAARECTEVMTQTDRELLAGRTTEEIGTLTEWLTTVHVRANGLLHQERHPHIKR